MSTREIEIPVKDLGEEVLFESDVSKVKVDVYWDSHGKKIYYDGHPCLTMGPCHVKIINHKRVAYENVKWDYWEMRINDTEFKGGIEGYKFLPKSRTLKVDAPWGWG